MVPAHQTLLLPPSISRKKLTHPIMTDSAQQPLNHESPSIDVSSSEIIPPSPAPSPSASLSDTLPLELQYKPDALRECSLLDHRNRFLAFNAFLGHLRFGDYTFEQLTLALDKAILLATLDLERQDRLLGKCRAYCLRKRREREERRRGTSHDVEHTAEGSDPNGRTESIQLTQFILNGARDVMDMAQWTCQRLQVDGDQILKDRITRRIIIMSMSIYSSSL